MPPATVTVVLIQAQPVPQLDSLANIDKALELLGRCQEMEADIICFPEYFPFHGEERLAGAARNLQAHIVAGLVEEAEGKRFNTATLFDRQGRLIGRQRKHNLGRLERRAYGVSPGEDFSVFETDFGRVGLPVCIDFWGQPEAARRLTDLGADLIINLGMFPILKTHWKRGALVRSFDNFMPVIGVNNASVVSLIGGREYQLYGGHSIAIQPPGCSDEQEFSQWMRQVDHIEDWIILEGGDGQEIFPISMDLAGPRRWRSVFWERLGIRR